MCSRDHDFDSTIDPALRQDVARESSDEVLEQIPHSSGHSTTLAIPIIRTSGSESHPEHFVAPKLTPHALPTLAIPGSPRLGCSPPSPNHTSSSPQSQSSPPTPVSAASLNSPITGVIDLTTAVRTLTASPVVHGGYSDIYKGEWERTYKGMEGTAANGGTTRQLVAIKLLRILSSREEDWLRARKRLNREVYVWSRLEHPNIVTFLGTTYHMDGRPAMVMHWFKNGSAQDYLKHGKADADRLSLALDVSRGLTYLHTLKPPVVHGDLKGGNVLINDDGRGVITDFGLSQVLEDLFGPTGLTLSNPGAGSTRWQAPEYLKEETSFPTLATDVWAFGCTAYELLTGNLPYPHRRYDPHIIQDWQNGASPEGPRPRSGPIWDLLRQCWRVTPSERINMSSMNIQLERLQQDNGTLSFSQFL